MSTILEKIEAFAKAREDALKLQRSDDHLVRWHMSDVLEIDPETVITDAEVDAFILRMGAEYLRMRLRGIGATKAARLYAKAKERTQ